MFVWLKQVRTHLYLAVYAHKNTRTYARTHTSIHAKKQAVRHPLADV